MTFNAKLVPMDYGHSYHIPADAIVKYIDGSVTVSHKILSLTDGRQALRLVITDGKPKKGDWYLKEDGSISNDPVALWQAWDKKVIATYPSMPDVPQIDLSDIRRWIGEGCKGEVGFYVEYDPASAILSEPIINPVLTNNTVKMVWGEQDKAQPIAGEVMFTEKQVISAYYKGRSDGSMAAQNRPIMQDFSDWLGLMKEGKLHDNPHEVIPPSAKDIELERLRSRPATNWDALRGKFKSFMTHKTAITITDIGVDAIVNFFKNEINGK